MKLTPTAVHPHVIVPICDPIGEMINTAERIRACLRGCTRVQEIQNMFIVRPGTGHGKGKE